MPLTARLYPLLKPLLFRMDPERAHEWTTRMMRLSHRLGLLAAGAPDTDVLPTLCMGLRLPNPVGLAAGMDKSASAVDAWGEIGFGAVEVDRASDGSVALTVRASPEQRPQVAQAVVGAGLDLLRLDQGAGQLESIFLRLTTHGQEVRA